MKYTRPLITMLYLFIGVCTLSSTLYAKRHKASAESTPAALTLESSKGHEQACAVPTPEPSPSTKPSKKRKKKEKKPKDPNKRFKDLTYEELAKKKADMLAAKNKDAAIKLLELMMPQCPDLHELHTLMLETADLYADTGDLDKASTLYKEFTKLYPGSAKVEYASYKAIECNFKQIRDAERDQSKTRETLELAQAFLERSDVFTTHAKDVQTMFINCQQRLFDSEFNIAKFYSQRGSYKAAQQRLDDMRTTFGIKLPSCEPIIITLEYDMAVAQENFTLAEQKKLDLDTRFPVQAPILLAHAQPAPRKLVNRF